MNSVIKKKWLEALRSGEYTQTKRVLRAANSDNSVAGYCCLGVLCDLYQKEVGGRWTPQSVRIFVDGVDDDYTVPAFQFETEAPEGKSLDYSTETLPFAVQKWAGMQTGNGMYGGDDPRAPSPPCLTMDNDSGKTFAQIADIIEEKF